MRLFVPTMVLALAAGLPANCLSAVTPRVVEPSVCQAGDTPGGEVVCEGQPPADCEGCGGDCDGQPGLLASVFGRFLNPNECEPHWSFAADAVALQRLSTRSQPLFRNTEDTVDRFNARDLNFPVNVGFQLNAIRRGPCGWELELGYFQFDNWAADASVPGESLMITSADGAGFFTTDGESHYKSAFHIGEINLRRQWCEGLTLLVGFRAGELNEFLGSSGIGARVPVPVSLNVNTFNHLYGLQVGGDYEFYNMGGPLRISALCKAGIYGNSAIQSSREIDTGTSDLTLAAHRNQAAFMGEAGAVATYQVTCHLSFRASCQAVWIEGLALAPEQIGANDFTAGVAGIDTHGGIFYYGGGLGAELKF
jgi:hypothetical protein